MESCVFCKIVKGESPAFEVFENEKFMVILDTRPVFLGHCLLIPKDHFQTFYDLPQDDLSPLFSLGQQVALAIHDALAAEGTFIAMNNHISQSVLHFHLHIIPRKKGDGLKGFFWPRQKYQEDEASMIQKKLKQSLEKIQHNR